MKEKCGTRFTTGCGHSWEGRRTPGLTVADLAGCTSNCRACGELVIIPGKQFNGLRSDTVPANVHMPLFHRYMHAQDPSWPVDGAGTGYVEFA